MSTEDPRCPECGGKIGQTATYCMHCQTDLSGGGEDRQADTAEADRGWQDDEGTGGWTDGLDGGSVLDDEPPEEATGVDAGTGESTGGAAGGPTGPGPGTGTTASGAATPGGASQPSGSTGTGEPAPGTQEPDGLLDPDGIVDNSLTVIVGIAGGIVIGVVGTATLLGVSGSPWAALVGLFVWIASTAHLVRRRTVQGAISRSAYGVAIVLLLVPLVFFSPIMSVDGGIGDRVAGFFTTLIAMAFPAGIAAVVGFVAGLFVPEDA